MSTVSNRTLVFENEGNKWTYKVKWTDVFIQITNCSYEKHVSPFLPIKEYKGPSQQERIVSLPKRSYTKNLTNLPNVAPLEFEEILIKHHTNPPAWFMGQKWIDFWYNSEENKINSKLNLKQQNKTLNKRRLFIATDEPKKIIEEAEKRWSSQYEFLHNRQNAYC
uniref:FUT8_N_cat domain-containing protein n=1 Tax=Meloidogyne hapla TaxID=6305 RepID=A0A1I8BFG7_MELHA